MLLVVNLASSLSIEPSSTSPFTRSSTPGHGTDIEADSQCPRRVAFRGFITETHHDHSVREAFRAIRNRTGKRYILRNNFCTDTKYKSRLGTKRWLLDHAIHEGRESMARTVLDGSYSSSTQQAVRSFKLATIRNPHGSIQISNDTSMPFGRLVTIRKPRPMGAYTNAVSGVRRHQTLSCG